MTASRTTRQGTPVRVTINGVERTGEFGTICLGDASEASVRIGHKLRFVPLADIEVIVPSAGHRFASLHMGVL